MEGRSTESLPLRVGAAGLPSCRLSFNPREAGGLGFDLSLLGLSALTCGSGLRVIHSGIPKLEKFSIDY